MKKIAQLVLLLSISMSFGQSFPIDFSDPLDDMFGDGCTFELTTDAANDVGSIIGGGELFDNAQLALAENLDLSNDANNTITFRIKPAADYGTRTHLLKFENGTGPNTELPFTTTAGTAWQDISIDFPGGLGDYGLMVLFTDFNNNEVGTYLIDDFEGGTNVTPPPPPAAEFPIDFETADDTFICFDCAFSIVDDAGNQVGSVTGGGLEFDTAQLNLASLLDLSDDANNTITFRIKPVNGTGSGSHLLKFEGGSGPNTELPFTTTGTDWQDISLDYPAGLGNYDLVVLFTDFNNTGIDTYLIDDFAGGTNITPEPDLETPSPTPTTPDAEVLSVYGDTGGFTNIWVSDYSFGETTVVDTDPSAVVNNTLKMDFSVAGYGEGTEPGTVTDVSAYGYFHFDYWTSEATQIRMILIEEDGAVQEYFYELPTQEPFTFNTWTSVDIPLTFFTAQGFSLDKFFQYKIGTLSDLDTGIVYFDNLYFSVNPGTSLSVEDFDIANTSVFPNPTTNNWTIKGIQNIESIQVYDILGKQVISLTPNSDEVILDASHLNIGLFFAKINTSNGSETIKLIKK